LPPQPHYDLGTVRLEPILVAVLSACAATIEPPTGDHGGGAAPGSGGAPDPGGAVDAATGVSGGGANVGGAAGNADNSGPGGGGSGGSGGTTGNGATGGTAGAASDGPPDTGSDAGAVSACPSLTDGWTAYQPTTTLQCEGGDSFCHYENSGGIELFKITKNPGNVRQRLEQRVHNDYLTGMNQFEGDVRVTSGDGTTVHQVFKFLMLVAYPKNGGELHQHSQTFLASHVFGTWIHVNTIHDVGARKTDIYFDCTKKTTMGEAAPSSPDGWYNKYGVYNLGGSEAQSEWKNVRYFRRVGL
jgi:hypothetical protein